MIVGEEQVPLTKLVHVVVVPVHHSIPHLLVSFTFPTTTSTTTTTRTTIAQATLSVLSRFPQKTLHTKNKRDT